MNNAMQPRTALSVNVNKVALLRNSRHLGIPSVTRAAQLCLQAGAQGITVHPRPDERHIRAQDVQELVAVMLAWPDREFNIEGNPFHNLMDFVRQVRRPVHQRPWMALSRRRGPLAAADRRMQSTGRAGQFVYGPLA